MRTSSDHNLIARLRRCDPDRYFTTLFAPVAQRESLALLYLFNHELARAREVTNTPMLALIRLQWWREVVEGQSKLHELASPLADAIKLGKLPQAELLGLIAAREAEAEETIPDFPSFLAYARGTGGRLARIAGSILGVDSPEIEDLGTAYAISGIIRSAPFLVRQGRSLLPADGTSLGVLKSQALALLAAKPPRGAFAAWAPASFVRRDLSKPYAPRDTVDRLVVLRAAFKGSP